jgi:signal transduction histidine kinase
LIGAHEEERRRLSRELHDGLGQRLALLSAELAQLQERVTSTPPILEQVVRLSAYVEDLGSELHRLSQALHPAWLAQLGLCGSIRRVCDEVSRAHRIDIQLELDEEAATLTNDAALAMYRITQEALHNVVRHSGTATATVRLAADCGEIVLLVIDHGRGFDPLIARARDGIGLVSMRERVRHLGGHMTLASGPGGTRVEARVPQPRSKDN